MGEVKKSARMRSVANFLTDLGEEASAKFPDSYFFNTARQLVEWADELEGTTPQPITLEGQ